MRLLVLAAIAQRANAQADAPTADQVKAAYLQKFTGYVDWPPKAFADPAAPFVIGVVGADSVFAELSRLVAGRTAQGLSPKASLQWARSNGWSVTASAARALRFPTVSELYQGSISSDAIVDNDPDLLPERSVTSELSWVRDFERGCLRATFFHEQTRDALYSQTNVTVAPSVTSIQNVGSIRTNGLELASDFRGVGLRDLDMLASVTYARSIIGENPNFPASVGKWQPRVPRWRANLLATYHPGTHWSFR